VETFIAWYSGDLIEWQNLKWRLFGPAAWMYWLCVICNVLIPSLFIFKKMRTNIISLFVISLLVNLGMWFERLMIIFTSQAHDFLPHNFGSYFPTWVELTITIGSFGFFFLWFFCFSKTLPTVPLSELKGRIADRDIVPTGRCATRVRQRIDTHKPSVLAVFSNAGRLLEAAKRSCDAGFNVLETFSPVKIEALDAVLSQPKSPVRLFTLAGALCGLSGGFWLATGTALVNRLVVGGKPPVSLIPFCVVGFEGTILLGSIGNLIGLVLYARLYRLKPAPYYDPRFSRDKFGLLVSCGAGEVESLKEQLAPAAPEEIHVHQ